MGINQKCTDSLQVISKCKYSSITGSFEAPAELIKNAEEHFQSQENSIHKRIRIQNFKQRVSKWQREKQQNRSKANAEESKNEIYKEIFVNSQFKELCKTRKKIVVKECGPKQINNYDRQQMQKFMKGVEKHNAKMEKEKKIKLNENIQHILEGVNPIFENEDEMNSSSRQLSLNSAKLLKYAVKKKSSNVAPAKLQSMGSSIHQDQESNQADPLKRGSSESFRNKLSEMMHSLKSRSNSRSNASEESRSLFDIQSSSSNPIIIVHNGKEKQLGKQELKKICRKIKEKKNSKKISGISDKVYYINAKDSAS